MTATVVQLILIRLSRLCVQIIRALDKRGEVVLRMLEKNIFSYFCLKTYNICLWKNMENYHPQISVTHSG